jgi:hypothetical protein
MNILMELIIILYRVIRQYAHSHCFIEQRIFFEILMFGILKCLLTLEDNNFEYLNFYI